MTPDKRKVYDATPPSLLPGWSLDTATTDQIRRQIRFELQALLDRNDLTQEALALQLDYETAGTVSKWVSGLSPLSFPGAKKLDLLADALGPPSVARTFKELVVAGQRRRAPRRAALEYDVFLASPMAAVDDAPYAAQRDEALNVKTVLENYCGFSVYYAGGEIRTHDDFESTDLSAEVNFSTLSSCRFFVLLVTCEVARPTSVWVEAGFAMALRVPSLYLIDSLSSLPFVMRTLNQHTVPAILPPVRIESLDVGQRASSLLRTQGKKIFQRLERES